MMMKNNRFAKKLAITLTSLLLAASCEVGLGEAIDITAPVVDVQSPAPMAIVQKDLLIKGVASDDYGVTEITVTVSASEMEDQKFRFDGKWKVFENDAWVDYEYASIAGTETRYNWEIQTQIPGTIQKKEVTIKTTAADHYSNEGASRIDERLVTVDGVAPTTTIAEPLMHTNHTEIQTLYDNCNLYDNAVLKNLSNGDFVIKVNQKENTRLGKFIVMLDEQPDTTIADPTVVPDLLSLPHVYSKEITTGTRSFEITVKREDFVPAVQNGKHLLRLVTESFDQGGNVSRTVHGFFIYWNEADRPWTELSLGDDEYKTTDQKQVYPSCALQGFAYDDDGLKTVEVTLEIYDNSARKWVKDSANSSVINLAEEDYPKNTAWTVTAPAESKHFRVTSKAIDKNGVEQARPLVKYFKISDVNPPQITVEVLPEGESQLGISKADAANPSEVGKFTVKGIAEDDGPIKSIKLVRIANKNKQNFLDYFNTVYAGWNRTVDGNLLFEVPITGGNTEPEGGYYKAEFAKDLYIFRSSAQDGGLGINGTGLKVEFTGAGEKKDIKISTDPSQENVKNHILLFRVEDSNGSVSIETVSLQGDIEPPKLTIDKVCVVPQEAGTWNKNSAGVVRKDLSTTDALPSYNRNSVTNAITDRLYFTGTWSDNSVAHWGDSTKIGEIYLYNSNGRLATVTANADGTWESALIVPEDTTTASVQALLSDFGGNTTKASASYYIASAKPSLLRITSSNPDGTYKNGDEITLVMEYNKKVTFAGGSSDPTLKLNNGGIAHYVKGNGESKHEYKYIVGSGSETVLPVSTKLKISSLNVSGNTWKDGDSAPIASPEILTGFNLDEVRSMYIDNANPRVKSITPVTGGGNYRIGKELFFQVEFNKDVTIKNLSDVKLKVNISGAANSETEMSAFSIPSSTSALFKYTVKAGDNTLNAGKADLLRFVSFSGGTDNILDVAKNPMQNFTAIDTTDNIAAAGIYIDTKIPEKPVVTGLVDKQLYYADIASIGFTGFESSAAATRYYSFDGGTSWTVYRDGATVKIAQNGTYNVCAKQVDLAGNESPVSDITTVTLDKGNLLTSISTGNPDGTYKRGDTLDIILSFRKEVEASNVALNLNVVNASGSTLNRKATLVTTGKSKKLHFTYPVNEADFCTKLNVTGIDYGTTGYVLDGKGTVVAGTKGGKTATGNIDLSKISPLTESRDIKLVNGKPVVQTVTLTKPAGAGEKERELRIKFNSEITKQAETKKVGAGTPVSLYITLKQTSNFEAPAVLTKSQWDEYSSTIKNFYKETTNGWNPITGTPDLSTKYVLKYENNTDNTTLVNALKSVYVEADHNISPDTVPVPMGSNYVKVDPADKTVLVISLKDDYTLPVQGADYTITIPAQIVENNIGERNDEVVDASTARSYVRTNSGVEAPVIRVNRKNENISVTTITQNPSTTYKVDCQTPGVTLNLKTKTATPKYVQLINNGGDNVIIAREASPDKKLTSAPSFGITVSDLTSAGTIAKKAEKTIGGTLDDATTTNNTGYKILIEATASKNGVSSVPAYESAMRTIIIYTESAGNIMTGKSDGGNYSARWIRGGDNTSGGVSTADFPLTWDSSDYNNPNRTVRAMTQWTSTTNTWYWVSWNVNTTAYVHFLAGDIPSDANLHGPSRWWWSSCAWTGMKTQTPAYAGECTIFPTNANSRYGGFQYLSGGTDGEKHRESR